MHARTHIYIYIYTCIYTHCVIGSIPVVVVVNVLYIHVVGLLFDQFLPKLVNPKSCLCETKMLPKPFRMFKLHQSQSQTPTKQKQTKKQYPKRARKKQKSPGRSRKNGCSHKMQNHQRAYNEWTPIFLSNFFLY